MRELSKEEITKMGGGGIAWQRMRSSAISKIAVMRAGPANRRAITVAVVAVYLMVRDRVLADMAGT